MTARKPKPKEPQPRPWVAVAITFILCLIALHQQYTAGKVADAIVGALVVLALFWAGRSVEGLDRLFRK